jgi:hypothetical protein
MKAKLINEVQEFKRGMDSKDALDLGGIQRQKNKIEGLGKDLEKIGIDWFSSHWDNDQKVQIRLDKLNPWKDFYVNLTNMDGEWIYVVLAEPKNRQQYEKIVFSNEDYKKTFEFIRNLFISSQKQQIKIAEEAIKGANEKIKDTQAKIKKAKKVKL